VREHIQRQIVFLKSNSLAGREIGIHFGLLAIYEKVGRNKTEYFNQARDILPELISACQNAHEYFKQLESDRKFAWPCFAYSERYLNKVKKTKKYLDIIPAK